MNIVEPTKFIYYVSIVQNHPLVNYDIAIMRL